MDHGMGAMRPHEPEETLSSTVGRQSTVGREVKRGAWRRPHEHLTRGALVGLVLWWLVVAALVIGGGVYTYVLEQV
jgi:hypothetical protein